MIEAVETLGLKRAGRAPSVLKIIEISDDVVDWVILDDDGKDCVIERVRRIFHTNAHCVLNHTRTTH